VEGLWIADGFGIWMACGLEENYTRLVDLLNWLNFG